MISTLKTFHSRKTNFEVKMCTTEFTNASTPTGWFYILYNHSQNETDSSLPSRPEIAFLLDSGESILVFKKPTYRVFTEIINFCNHDQHDTSKTLIIESNSNKFLSKQSYFVTCFSSIETERSYFMIPSADIKQNILGTPIVRNTCRMLYFKIL